MSNAQGDDPADRWDALLSKYVRVWLWSVLLGTTSALSYSYVNVHFDRPWGSLASLPLLLMVLGTTAAFASWFNLLAYLRMEIIPTFFTPPGDRRKDWETTSRASRQLVMAYQFFLISALTRLSLVVSDLLFELLRFKT
jgi:hypothetical protein